jgi:hypothetical protein
LHEASLDSIIFVIYVCSAGSTLTLITASRVDIVLYIRLGSMALRILDRQIALMHEARGLSPLDLRACVLFVLVVVKATDIISTFSLS